MNDLSKNQPPPNDTSSASYPVAEARFTPATPPSAFTIFGAVLLLVLVAAHWKTIDSADALFQIKAGNVIYNTGTVPNRDIFSAASRVNQWVFFEWLWSAGASAAYRIGDWIGVSALNVALSLLVYGLMLVRARMRKAGWLEALCVTFITGFALLPEFQPEASYAVLPLYVLTLIITDAAHRWPMVILPPLVALWANMHPGVLLTFVAPIANLLVPASNPLGESRRKVYLVVIILAGLAALLINPHSVRIVPALWELAARHSASALSNFRDAFLEVSFLLRAVLICVFFVLALAARKLTRRDGLNLVVLGATTIWLSPSTVNFLLLYLAAPASGALSQLLKSTWSTGRVRYLSGATVLLVCIGWASVTAYATRLTPESWGTGIRPRIFPETAAGRLAAIPLRSSILNLKEHGGYLVWRLWPTWKITSDNRVQIYEPEFGDNYEGIWAGQTGWQDYLFLWRVHAVLGDTKVSDRYPSQNLYYELAGSDEWSAVYWDRESILYVKSDIELASTNLSEFRRLKPGLPWNELTALQKTSEDWRELKADLRRALIDDPGNEIALEFLKRAEAEN